MTPFQVLLTAGLVFASCISASELVGGRVSAELDGEDVIRAAQFAAREIDSMFNSLFAIKMTKVVKAETQVVAGMKYFLTIELRETECMKNGGPVEDLDSCKVREDFSTVHICEVTVLESAWNDNMELLHYSCNQTIE